MIRLSRSEGHLFVAGVRVLAHRLGRGPTPPELAELLLQNESQVRLQAAALEELGAVALVTSAFETHLEVRDHLRLEHLEEGQGPAIGDALRDFDERKREEAEKMARLFDTGEAEQARQDQLRRMDEDLRDFRRKRPRNPFGDD
ncbi:hypothetical protein FJ250_05140 [bacterium]|nr:hypothetical protein [bacterium]